MPGKGEKDDYSKVPLVIGDDSDIDNELYIQNRRRDRKKEKFRNRLRLICLSFCIILLLVVTISLVYVVVHYKLGYSHHKHSHPTVTDKTTSDHHDVPISSPADNPVPPPAGHSAPSQPSHPKKPHVRPHKKYHQTDNWEKVFKDVGSESVIRLVDIDDDGRQDIIFGAALSADLNKISGITEDGSLVSYCKSLGLAYPCIGVLYGMRGYDGKILWKTKVRSGTLLINCEHFDINKDGTKDCIVTGRQALIEAINIKNGEHLWTGQRIEFMKTWNIYQAMPLPDFNSDGVNEVLIVHGGDPNYDSTEHNRPPARLVMLNGATGKTVGRYFTYPGGRESYQSPVIYNLPDGSQYILLGTGGETVSGDFMMLSVPDFYRFVMQLPSDEEIPNTRGSYSQWPHLPRDPGTGLITVYSGLRKGVMVPPLTTDVNRDGVDDIVMSAYDGLIILYDGKTMEKKWEAKFPNCESYSTPAPGFFNDDDTLDFMVHWSTGAWPFYNESQKVIIDGRDGSIMWRMNMRNYEMSSDLTIQTDEPQRDMYVYKTKGRGAKFFTDITGEVHGVGVQRVINKRDLNIQGKMKKAVPKEAGGVEGNPLSPHYRKHMTAEEMDKQIYEDYRKHHFSCDDDIDIYAEAFMMDRTVLDNPVRIMKGTVKKRHYHPINSSTNKEDKSKTFCSVMLPEDRSTASIGDLDGDGTLDYVTLLSHAGEAVDSGYSYYNMFYDFSVVKINLDPLRKDKSKRVKVNITTTLHKEDYTTEKDISEVKLLPLDEQQWLTYFGTNQNGHFINKPRQ